MRKWFLWAGVAACAFAAANLKYASAKPLSDMKRDTAPVMSAAPLFYQAPRCGKPVLFTPVALEGRELSFVLIVSSGRSVLSTLERGLPATRCPPALA